MLVKVWNRNKYPYKEQFRDENVYIPAGNFIEMEKDKAEIFFGTFNGIMVDGDGNPDPKGYKMLDLEYPSGADVHSHVKVNELLCMACRYLAVDKPDLQAHLTTHEDIRANDPEAEKAAASRKRASA